MIPLIRFVPVLLLSNAFVYYGYSRYYEYHRGTTSPYSNANPDSATATAATATTIDHNHNLLAYRHSLGYFDDPRLTDDLWIEVYQTPAILARHYRWDEPGRKNKGVNAPAFWYYFNWDPYFPCPAGGGGRVRFGGLGDGPKYTCAPRRLRRLALERQRDQQQQQQPQQQQQGPIQPQPQHRLPSCLVYSFVTTSTSSPSEFAWEYAMADLLQDTACEVHVFYHHDRDSEDEGAGAETNGVTSKTNRPYSGVLFFHPWRLRGQQHDLHEHKLPYYHPADQENGNKHTYDETYRGLGGEDKGNHSNNKNVVLTLDEIRQRLGHAYDGDDTDGDDAVVVIDVLKIDCRGCEWYTWKDLVSDDRIDIRQLLMKTYDLPLQHTKKRFIEFEYDSSSSASQGVIEQDDQPAWVLPKMKASDLFDTFASKGYALFAKEVDCAAGRDCKACDWSWIKLAPEFFKPKTNSTQSTFQLNQQQQQQVQTFGSSSVPKQYRNVVNE